MAGPVQALPELEENYSMAEKKDEKVTGSTPKQEKVEQQSAMANIWGFLTQLVNFFWEIIRNLAFTIRSTVYLFVNTLPVLLPSVVNTSSADDQYNRWLSQSLGQLTDNLEGLSTLQKQVLHENWLSQMEWVENRATRERNANELIRWWQIILGVLIPVFIQVNLETVASVAGVFVAVITAVHQFRRPDDRWRHYRMLAERYKMEFWAYVTLSNEEYKGKTHADAFNDFDSRMNELRREDMANFFGQVVPPSASTDAQQQMALMQRYMKQQGIIAPVVVETNGGDSPGG